MTHEQNERLLTLLSEYLCFQADAIAPADVAAFSADAHLPQEDAYRMLLSAKLGLDPDRAEDWLLIRDALPKIIRRCDPADYAQDEYLRRIAPGMIFCRWMTERVSLSWDGSTHLSVFLP